MPEPSRWVGLPIDLMDPPIWVDKTQVQGAVTHELLKTKVLGGLSAVIDSAPTAFRSGCLDFGDRESGLALAGLEDQSVMPNTQLVKRLGICTATCLTADTCS